MTVRRSREGVRGVPAGRDSWRPRLPGPRTPWPTIREAGTARRTLDAILDTLAGDGVRTPCQGPGRNDWTSDEPDARARAALACGPCPAFWACADVATAERPTAGVWAGRPRGEHRPRKDPDA